MPLLRKSLATALGINADNWQLDAFTIRRRPLAVVVELSGYLIGADPTQADTARADVRVYTFTGSDAQALVGAILKAGAQAAILNAVKAALPEFADATVE